MQSRRKVLSIIALAAMIILLIYAATGKDPASLQKSFWALMPSLVAIILALITKEVYSSLFIGIVSGALLYTDFHFTKSITTIYSDTIIKQLTDPFNMGLILFLIILGALVSLMNRSGGSAAFGRWAVKHIHSRAGAQFATVFLGMLIFIDDYFNCLTVGNIMRPITDRFHVSRAKLAYLIDSTAAPICIIAPISSWAAAVSAFVQKDQNGITLFVHSIPWNFYALFTIAFMMGIIAMKTDYGPMEICERKAIETGESDDTSLVTNTDADEKNGHLIDMLLPVILLIIGCTVGLLWTGGAFHGKSIVVAFAKSDTSVGLAVGAFFAFLLTIGFYLIRHSMAFKDITECLIKGFESMVPPIMVLTLAWSLKAITEKLGARDFVAGIVKSSAGGVINLLPLLIFGIAVGLSFAIGTSWGTFGLMIPIVIAALGDSDPELMIIAVSACIAGAVCGDHCSPISDTTIMSSAGSQCNHIDHVSTQLPYSLTVAAISALTYLVAGFCRNVVVSLVFGLAVTFVCLVVIRRRQMARR